MYEYELEKAEPVCLEELEPGEEDLTDEEWNQIMASEIACGEDEFDDAIELPDDRSGLAPDEDLPEMDDIIHNIWEC